MNRPVEHLIVFDLLSPVRAEMKQRLFDLPQRFFAAKSWSGLPDRWEMEVLEGSQCIGVPWSSKASGSGLQAN
jgi:hypothetical protein